MRDDLDSNCCDSSRAYAQKIQNEPAFQPEREVLPASGVFVHCVGLSVQGIDVNFKHRCEAFQRLQTGFVTTLNSLNCSYVQAGHLGQLFLREMAANPHDIYPTVTGSGEYLL